MGNICKECGEEKRHNEKCVFCGERTIYLSEEEVYSLQKGEGIVLENGQILKLKK